MNSKEKNKKKKNVDLSMRKQAKRIKDAKKLKKEQEALAEELAAHTINIPPFRRGS
ncbi:hypothetical protein [Vibrio marisflavi]|uniref:Uncharacterized protein n=1 Tax=Vibrio marisflavi CECT 7928 TaxID=634439 RepID=A0ABM9AAA2_9VIBR|nr:hypothetical protein [Vibrio marisflavi]CAH0543381.1 hypothetical protein VMF7928_04521 [Vibrio marisflavi CECT 7928]